jgi:hypothetical protein
MRENHFLERLKMHNDINDLRLGFLDVIFDRMSDTMSVTNGGVRIHPNMKFDKNSHAAFAHTAL